MAQELNKNVPGFQLVCSEPAGSGAFLIRAFRVIREQFIRIAALPNQAVPRQNRFVN
jgi:hypothetical protein